MNKSLARSYAVAAGIMLGVFLGACGTENTSNSDSSLPYINATLTSQPTGTTLQNFNNAMVTVREGSSSGGAITTATVVMNGQTLSYVSAHQDYEGDVAVSAGGAVSLSVTVNGVAYTANSTQFDTYPTILSPSSASIWYASSNQYITWSGGSPTSGAFYVLGVLDANDPNGTLVWPSSSSLTALTISTTGYTVPANNVTAGNRVILLGIAKAVDVGAASGSILGIVGMAALPITVQ